MKRTLTFSIIVLLLLAAAAAAYLYYMLYVPAKPHVTVTNPDNTNNNGFTPLNTGSTGNSGQNGNGTQTGTSTSNNNSSNNNPNTQTTNRPVPVLRQLSATPIGGYGVQHLATSTLVRWIDRGRGNIFEANSRNNTVYTLSNTLVPRIYRSSWNKDLTAFSAQYISDTNDQVSTIIANVIKTPVTKVSTQSSTSSDQVTETPFQLKGRLVNGNISQVTNSPAHDKILFVKTENYHSIGYISKFDGSGQTQIFDVPMTQIYVDWPEENTITLGTKASALYAGYFYKINIKTGEMKAVISNVTGLRALLNHDASKVFYSYTGSDTDHILSAVTDLKTGKTTKVLLQTLADKCTWGNKNKQQLYCAVPSQLYDGTYPDDWYLGGMTFVDKIWSLDTTTNKATRLAVPVTDANAIIDALNLQTDSNDEFLYLMNKNNLGFWSLDLASTN